MFAEIIESIRGLDETQIAASRKAELKPLIDHIREKALANQSIRINFICTHNSRRSHLAQVWMQTLAHYYNLTNIQCYSGGTEATAVFPQVIQTLKDTGFQIKVLGGTHNPLYGIIC